MKTQFIVQSASAHMPNKVRHPYRRVAVLEVVIGAQPKMISRRARGVVRIVETWERLNVGLTARCAYQRALAEATALAAKLNSAAQMGVK